MRCPLCEENVTVPLAAAGLVCAACDALSRGLQERLHRSHPVLLAPFADQTYEDSFGDPRRLPRGLHALTDTRPFTVCAGPGAHRALQLVRGVLDEWPNDLLQRPVRLCCAERDFPLPPVVWQHVQPYLTPKERVPLWDW